jgi:3-oxo-5-alpha-steroid 4-dehydrogenase 1
LKEYDVFIACWSGVGIGAGLYLLRKEAPYGRFSNNNWGPMISNRLGWFLMELAVMMIALFFIHYIHRSLVYPFMIRTKGKKMPVVIMFFAILFNTVNGSLLGIWFAKFARYPANWYLSPMFITGSILFIAGMIINWWSDYYLVHLREKGDTGYKIPQAGLFKLIASPNLLGEIIEWGGFALLTWSLPGLAFFVWTCANLAPRAIANHRW